LLSIGKINQKLHGDFKLGRRTSQHHTESHLGIKENQPNINLERSFTFQVVTSAFINYRQQKTSVLILS